MDMKVIPIQPERSNAWHYTPAGEPRGFVQPHALEELWFHTGTACNLACPFCLEGSKPGDGRLDLLRFAEARPYIDEALTLGVRQFSFTGGEPFVTRDLSNILYYALQYRPCLVLTNATEPLHKRLRQIATLRQQPHALHFRVSLDHYDAARHDALRGEGMFEMALEGMRRLHSLGFALSVASQRLLDVSSEEAEERYSAVFVAAGLPPDLPRIEFPEFHLPGADICTPQISAHCMDTNQTEQSRRAFMCAFSKMVVKCGGRTRVYACTLVDDDPEYDLGATLTESLRYAVSMKHHRCYSCFAHGASCSEMRRR
jgi:sulfatase maturation enzyme AslB (radical SAM superfamily)